MENKTPEIRTNADYFDHIDESITRFKAIDTQSQLLYDSFKPLVDIGISKVKNSLTSNGGMRDLSECINALGGIGTSSVTAINNVVAAATKKADIMIKLERINKDNDEGSSVALLMREVTEQLNKNKTKTTVSMTRGDTGTSTKVSTELTDIAEDNLLDARLSKELKKGTLKINSNESNMKHDYNGTTYAFDDKLKGMVVLDSAGKKIDNFPEERIPEKLRFSHLDEGTPVDFNGDTIKPYVG